MNRIISKYSTDRRQSPNPVSILYQSSSTHTDVSQIAEGTRTIGDRPKCPNRGRFRLSIFNETPLQRQFFFASLPTLDQSVNRMSILDQYIKLLSTHQIRSRSLTNIQIQFQCANPGPISKFINACQLTPITL